MSTFITNELTGTPTKKKRIISIKCDNKENILYIPASPFNPGRPANPGAPESPGCPFCP